MLDDVAGWIDLDRVPVSARCLAVTALMQASREIQTFQDSWTKELARCISPAEHARTLLKLGALTKLATRTWSEMIVGTREARDALAATVASIGAESRYRQDTLDRLLDLPATANRLNLDFALSAARLPAKVRPAAKEALVAMRAASEALEAEVLELHAFATAHLSPGAE
jgi:hypothetical protein